MDTREKSSLTFDFVAFVFQLEFGLQSVVPIRDKLVFTIASH